MIEEIEIENFRAISKPVTIRLRPITILIGKNSAGKSTLVKFLLMLRQTLETRPSGFFVDFLETGGRHVELGALRHLCNRNPGNKSKKLRFEIRLRTAEAPSIKVIELLQKLGSVDVETPNGFGSAPASAEGAKSGPGDETLYDIRAELQYAKPEVGRQLVTAYRSGKEMFTLRSLSLKDVRFLSSASNTARPEGELEAMGRDSFLRPAREVLTGIRHVGPVRNWKPEPGHTNVPADSVGRHGEYAVPHLYRLLKRGGRAADFVMESIREIANVDELEFKARALEFDEHFQGRNRDAGAKCHLDDFGFGVSQCVPIFVQGALLQMGQLLMVEQPEAQLHPTAQLGLGTFFATLWKDFGVPSLIETHSDNLLLRIRKLVAKNKKAKVRLSPDDVSIAYFHVEDRYLAVKNLDIREDGSLERGLPMEFFGADLLEAPQRLTYYLVSRNAPMPGVTIDSSVFEHLFNTARNANNHIDAFLRELAKKGYQLCVDDSGRITGEYQKRLVPIIKNDDDTDDRRRLLQFWIVDNPKLPPYAISLKDNLMTAIKFVIHEKSETIDRAFVYVAITSDTRIVSNDQHIVGSKNIPGRRKDLEKLAKKEKTKTVAFLMSHEAADDIVNW